MKICIVATDYPDSMRSTQEFVKQVVVEWADMGNECVVIAPFDKNANKGYVRKRKEEQTTSKGNNITIIRPIYYSTVKFLVGKFNLYYVLHGMAVLWGLITMHFKPDFIYCHFWSNALESYTYARFRRMPLFVASGEAVVPAKYNDEHFKNFFDFVRGTICVSQKTLKENLAYGMTKPNKSIVIPNAINPHIFFKQCKTKCREQLGFPMDAFIAIYVGDFGERKGVMRVSDAISQTTGDTIYSIFIGKGELYPNCNGILHCGPIKHELLPVYLNSADCFVLPTLNEGCCNAIIEALACGLPVISANAPYNYDILSERNAILINPNSVEEIKSALIRLRDDVDYRNILALNAEASARHLTINKRASDILKFINGLMNKYETE